MSRQEAGEINQRAFFEDLVTAARTSDTTIRRGKFREIVEKDDRLNAFLQSILAKRKRAETNPNEIFTKEEIAIATAVEISITSLDSSEREKIARIQEQTRDYISEKGENPLRESLLRRTGEVEVDNITSVEQFRSSEDPNSPEYWLPKRDKRGKPAVCLSDLEEYLKVELPTGVHREETDEGTVIELADLRLMNDKQATRAALEMLCDGILYKHAFGNITRTWIEKYVERVGKVTDGGKNSKLYKDLWSLAQNCFVLQKIIYEGWGEKGKGAKHSGAVEMISAVSKEEFANFPVWFFLQDPVLEGSMHRIKGETSDEDFVRGKSNDERGGKGAIFAGNIGACEKVAHYVGLITLLRGLDGVKQVASSSYTANVLLYPLEYFNKGPMYASAMSILVDSARKSDDDRRAVIFTNDVRISPSAFHNRAMADWVWDNFSPETFGWTNVGRMLSLLNGGEKRDPRWRLRGQEGVYTLEEFLLADNQTQERMARAAYGIYLQMGRRPDGSPSNDKRKIKIQKRILKINTNGSFYYKNINEQQFEDGVRLDDISWERKPVLDFDEADGKGNKFVDIGSFKAKYWGDNKSFNFLNSFWTDFEYAYRFQDDILDTLSQMDPVSLRKRLEAGQEIFGAKKGLRHLSESIEITIDFARSLISGREMLYELSYERQELIVKLWERISQNIELSFWDDRRNARERLKWAENLNQFIRSGYDIQVYAKEFEACGIYNRNWAMVDAQNRFTEEEKVAKIMGKFERPDVWCAWLKKIGLTKNIEDQVRALKGQDWRPPEVPQEWQRVGINNYWDYLTYNAIVSFAGYEVTQVFVENDLYGNLVPRVKFKLAFDDSNEREKTNGNYWKSILTFLDIPPEQLVNLSNDQREDYLRRNSEAKNRLWEGVNEVLVGVHRGGRLVKYGELTETTFAMFLQFYEKMHEEYIIDALIENYLADTFDNNEKNWIFNKWGKHLRHKKRWDTWATIRRQMKYSVGELGKQDYWVHDQVALDPEGRIIVDNKGLPSIAMSVGPVAISDPRTMGFDHVASMTLGSAGVFRPKEELMTPPRDANDRREYYYRRLTGMGDAGEEKQLSWMPLYFNKTMMFNFVTARFFDSEYVYEQSVNGRENWEDKRRYLYVADEVQRLEFFEGLETIAGEDRNWVAGLEEKFGILQENIDEFSNEKARLLIRDVKAEVSATTTEDELITMQKMVHNVTGIGKILPVFRTIKETLSFATTAVPFGFASTVALNAVGAFSSIGGFIWYVPVVLGSVVFGLQFTDKGVFKESGREKADGIIQRWMGGPHELFGINFAFGMYGKRVLKRSPDEIARGLNPCWDSALPINDLLKMFFVEYKKTLKPAELK